MSAIALATGLAEFVPSIVNLIMGDKAGKVAERVVDSAKRITGEDEIDDIKRLLKESPDLVLRFQKEVEELTARLEQGYIEDRQNARARDRHLQALGNPNRRADIMVLSAAGGLISCLVTLSFFRNNLGGEAIGIISTISGIFGSCLKDAYAFEFGSSRENGRKDSMLQFLLKNSATRSRTGDRKR